LTTTPITTCGSASTQADRSELRTLAIAATHATAAKFTRETSLGGVRYRDAVRRESLWASCARCAPAVRQSWAAVGVNDIVQTLPMPRMQSELLGL
jgi:hypothetical protein